MKHGRALVYLALLILSSLAGMKVAAVTSSGPNHSAFSTGFDTSDVPLYDNMDSATTGRSPTKGAGTVLIGVSVSTVTGQVNNALTHTVGNAAGRVSFSTAPPNFSIAGGCFGFYWTPTVNSAGTPVYISTFSAGQQMRIVFSAGTAYLFRYKNLFISINISSNTTHFIEWAYSSDESAGFAERVRIDGGGGVWTSTSGATGGDPTIPSTIVWGPLDANAVNGTYDQVMYSTNPLKELYPMRDNTSF